MLQSPENSSTAPQDVKTESASPPLGICSESKVMSLLNYCIINHNSQDVKVGPTEMVWWIRILSWKHEVLSSNPYHTCNQLGMDVYACNPRTGAS